MMDYTIQEERIEANENAIPFYEKLGMRKTNDVMQYNHIEWTEFTVK